MCVCVCVCVCACVLCCVVWCGGVGWDGVGATRAQGERGREQGKVVLGGGWHMGTRAQGQLKGKGWEQRKVVVALRRGRTVARPGLHGWYLFIQVACCNLRACITPPALCLNVWLIL